MRFAAMLGWRPAAPGRGAVGFFAAGLLCATACADDRPADPVHPLDPLSRAEIAITKEVLARSGRFSTGTEFAWIQLHEPPKAAVEAFHQGDDFARKADAAAVDFEARKSFAVTVDLKAGRIDAIAELEHSQPGLTDRDVERARAIVSADPRVRAALVRHGLDVPVGLDSIRALYLAVGTDPTAPAQGGRLVRVLFSADQDAVNDYGPILDSVMALVDVYAGRVVVLYDRPGVPIVKVRHDIFDPTVRGTPGETSVPRVTVMGRSFKVEDNLVAWGPWRLRLGFNGREGLVLYQVAFDDHGRLRPVVYRASVSEVLSRYGDATNAWPWMELFDESSFGLGALSSPVVPGREVPGNAVTLGPARTGPGDAAPGESSDDRIYAYERDGGNLMYYRQGEQILHARATELVIGFMVPLGNYTYALNWVFKQDGSFAFVAELAGEILTKLTRAAACGTCGMAPPPASAGAKPLRPAAGQMSGTLVAPHVVGVDHQHWFSLRLDFDVDGTDNAVAENNVRRLTATQSSAASGQGPYFTLERRVLPKALDARRDADDETSRTWTIFNPHSRGKTGRAAGYEVVPLGNTTTVYPSSREKGPAAFTFHHLWVTPYREGQLFADGRYPNQPSQSYGDTLYHFANADSIYDRDIVVWYSLGETHVPRPEDYPLMDDATLSVLFRPDGFFETNPALGAAEVPDGP